MLILLICTGNTCRSPMAEILMKEEFKKRNININVRSAGLSAFEGEPASHHAIVTMKSYGLSLQNHQAHLVETNEIRQADLILTMTYNHRLTTLFFCPDCADKIYTLSEFAGANENINDPFGADLEIYKQCAISLLNLIIKAADIISREYL